MLLTLEQLTYTFLTGAAIASIYLGFTGNK